ncbi:sulfite reductase flavoprotein subunit alpha [Chlamydia suis]|uniref:Flavoprotein alpha-component n=1 Tax=Chlamydia suis TaxID=83559 RepID=A0ABX6ITI8_9CHLA|nr:sulfite reductase flavoprotein subunit alpha [Chlamydia suis]QHP83645.1 flavoprotein alpha-component [Chlamydia suis]
MSLFAKFKALRMVLHSRELCSSHQDGVQTSLDPVFKIVCGPSQSKISYKVGDALGVFPTNSLPLVNSILSTLQYDSRVFVASRYADSPLPVQEFLLSYADLDKFPKALRPFFPEDLDDSWSLAEAILFYRPSIPFEKFINGLSPLLPRFYSIASSPDCSHGQLELLVRCISFPGKEQVRYGLCSAFLCKYLQEGMTFQGFIQPTRYFTLEKKSFGKPLIMVGAGTGIAPYKGFLQHRLYHQDPGANFLFFGERFEKSNFYYRDFLQDLIASEKLQLFTAFSRDAESKMYVQDVIEQQKELIQENYEKGAFFFICGKKIIGTETKRVLGNVLGLPLVQELILEKRLILDVY